MKTVKAYDIDTFMREDSENKWKSYSFHRTLAILQGPKGVILCCSEGVHWMHDDLDSEFEVDLEKVRDDNRIAVMPEGRCRATIQELLDNCTHEEVELGQFVRRFGHRLENNYYKLLKAVKEIGLNPEDYPRGEKKTA